ncbi:MAG: TetR/AcrR family transcriptional regulator [Clostridia bacterium]|nr:TetR/AcrR family transcriptional regulator [Clostridia bacterium]
MIGQGKRQIQAENSRKKLLSVAGELFFKHGFKAVSVNDICREAGMTKGAFYYHFASKDELYGHLFTPQLDAYLDAHYDLDDQASARARFVRIAQCTLGAGRELGKDLIIQNMHALMEQKTSTLFIENRTHTRLLDEAIKKARSEGSFRVNVNRDEAIMMYSFLMNGFLFKWVSASEEEEKKYDWDELLRQEISLLVDEV